MNENVLPSSDEFNILDDDDDNNKRNGHLPAGNNMPHKANDDYDVYDDYDDGNEDQLDEHNLHDNVNNDYYRIDVPDFGDDHIPENTNNDHKVHENQVDEADHGNDELLHGDNNIPEDTNNYHDGHEHDADEVYEADHGDEEVLGVNDDDKAQIDPNKDYYDDQDEIEELQIIESYLDVTWSTNEIYKTPNKCEFNSHYDAIHLPIRVGNEHVKTDLFNIYWWTESEYNALLGRYGPKFTCKVFCETPLSKFWFNKYSDSMVGYFFRDKAENALQVLETKKIEKDGDILVMISNCVEERFHYVSALLDQLRTEFPGIIIRTCGKCFGDDHPDCPPRVDKTYNTQIMWVARHRYMLAFENSLCPGYITEKLYNPLVAGTVPIVQSTFTYPDFLDPVKDRVIISDEFVDYLKTHDYKDSWRDLVFSKDELLDVSVDFPDFFSGTCDFIRECLKDAPACQKRQVEKRDRERKECMDYCAKGFECVAPYADYNPRPYSGNY